MYKDDKCYKIFDLLLTFNQAKVRCAEVGGTLLSIESNNQQEFLSNYFYNVSGITDSIWLGTSFNVRYDLNLCVWNL